MFKTGIGIRIRNIFQAEVCVTASSIPYAGVRVVVRVSSNSAVPDFFTACLNLSI